MFISAVENGRLTPSTLDIIQDIDEAKLAKDMDNVLNDLSRSKDKAEIMRKLRLGKTNNKTFIRNRK